MAEESSSTSTGRVEDQAGRPEELHSGSPEGVQEAKCLDKIACPKCGDKAGQVVHMETKVRRGWYCGTCLHFEPAVNRERLL